jgi:hypothetical protein
MILTSVTRTFEAAHLDEAESPYRHGHEFTVRVVQRDINSLELGSALDDIIREIHLRDLDVMIAGGSTSLEGIAAWFMERLVLRFSLILEVWVSIGPEDRRRAAVFTREIR